MAAHRALQNVAIADHRRGELLSIYRSLRDAQPTSAERWYLWGRIQVSPTRQKESFERAQSLDPASPWPKLGLGVLALRDGDVKAARRFLAEAHALGPDVPDLELGEIRGFIAEPMLRERAATLLESSLLDEPWDLERVLLLADCRERQGRAREALELLGRSLARAPRHSEVARRLLARLSTSATLGDVDWLARELALVADEPLPTLVLARCHAMRGDAAAALAAWESATELDAEARSVRRLLWVLRGDVVRALDADATRYRALERLGVDVSPWQTARTLAARLGDGVAVGTASDRLDLARALVRLGAIEEASAVLRPLRGQGVDAADELRSRLEQQRHLEAELKVLAIETYRAHQEGREAPAFDVFTGAIDLAAERTSGAPSLASASRQSIWPLGELVDPTGGGLPGWFAEGGRLLVVGQRRGLPPELFLAPVVASSEAGPQRARVSWIDGTLIPGWLEHSGAQFAGAALDRFAWIDIAAIEDQIDGLLAFSRRLGADDARLRADPVEPARGHRERCAIEEPAEVVAKLELRALAAWRERDPKQDPATLLADALDAVLRHESAHLADAHRFLPLSRKVWGELFTLGRLGFAPRKIEEWLEMRAQCSALATARNPWFVLADCAASLRGDAGGLTPHGDGYRDLLARFVAVIDAAPADFEGVDRGAVLLQQLDLLSEAQLRLAARRLGVELDIELGVEIPATIETSPR
ncbi:MAG: tetratricopeptide repeat protein [Planctomycetes bacterium]|nr:tetratricopeptide repeat protein [Planctomycetota bacterium]